MWECVWECVCVGACACLAGGHEGRRDEGEVGGGEQPGERGRWCWCRRWRAGEGEGEGGESIALKSEEVGLGQPPP